MTTFGLLEKAELDLATAEREVKQAQRRLEKIRNANSQYREEPPIDTVLKFFRNIAGGDTFYTFVAVRTQGGWSVTGRKNALNGIGLKESGNTWDDLRISVGQNNFLEATGWRVGSDG